MRRCGRRNLDITIIIFLGGLSDVTMGSFGADAHAHDDMPSSTISPGPKVLTLIDHLPAFFVREGKQGNDDLFPYDNGRFLLQGFRFSVHVVPLSNKTSMIQPAGQSPKSLTDDLRYRLSASLEEVLIGHVFPPIRQGVPVVHAF